MGDRSAIEWTDASWNPIVGCSIVSPGCTNCYAMRQAHRMKHFAEARTGSPADTHYFGTTKVVNGKPVWTGMMRAAPEHILLQPLRWRRPRMIFANSMSDLFHESISDEEIDRVFAVMAVTPWHTYQVLTKRSGRMRRYFSDRSYGLRWIEAMRRLHPPPNGRGMLLKTTDGALPNVWLGVSTEDQRRADERVPDLLATPATVRFVSAEPLLGPIEFDAAWHGESALGGECWGDCAWCEQGHPPLHNCHRGRQSTAAFEKGRSGLDWIIVGGESGPGARPMHPDWARSIRDQCEAADVPFFFKQWGEWCPATSDFGVSGHQMPATDEKFTWIGWDGRTQNPSWHGLPAPVMAIAKMGKRRAGRLLDGREHSDMPRRAA